MHIPPHKPILLTNTLPSQTHPPENHHQFGVCIRSIWCVYPRAHGTQLAIHLACRGPHDEVAQGIACHPNVLKRPHYVNACVCHNNARLGCVFNCEFGLAVFTSQATNSAGQVLTTQGLWVWVWVGVGVGGVQHVVGHAKTPI